MERGRPRCHDSAAQKQRAYRQREKDHQTTVDKRWESLTYALRQMRDAWCGLPEESRNGIDCRDMLTQVEQVNQMTQFLRTLIKGNAMEDKKPVARSLTGSTKSKKLGQTETKIGKS